MKPTYHLISQLIIYLFSFLFIFLNSNYDKISEKSTIWFFVLSVGLWFVVLWLTHTHKPKLYQIKLKYIIAPYIKSILLINMFNLVLIKIFISDSIIVENAFLAVIIYSLTFFIIYITAFYFIVKRRKYFKKSSIDSTKKYIQNDLNIKKSLNLFIDDSEIPNNLIYFNSELIDQLIGDSDSETSLKLHIYRNKEKMRIIPEKIEVCIFDKKLNNVKDINSNLHAIYETLIPGGFLLLVFEELEDFEEKYLSSKPHFFSLIKKIFYYIYYRGLPKIPLINKIYFFLSMGKNRVIAKAEVWGRLVYNGLVVKKQVNSNGLTYLLVTKELELSTNPNPSFYPIITLNRVALNSEIIKIHKVRSMYPYSEFLQKRIFEENNLSSLGKFGDDFRITKLGKFYRKYWIDELPQLLDWFRGEIKLVGIRAMSQHFFSLYPEEYKNIFIKVKPGLIPPLFDENTDGFDEIVKIESTYLQSYIDNPIKTDFKYFWLTITHIFVKGVRST